MLLPLSLLPDPDGAKFVSASLESDETKFILVILWPCPPQPEPSCTKVVPPMLVLQHLRGSLVHLDLTLTAPRRRPGHAVGTPILQPDPDSAEVISVTLQPDDTAPSSILP